MSANPPKHFYRPEIDGLRAFAVLSVVLFHADSNWLQGGFIGVDVFFVISGFLITSHLFEKLDKGAFSLTDFFSRRIKRIFPALIVVMVSSLVFGWFVLLADEFNLLGKHIAGGAIFISNFLYANEFGYFDSSPELKPMLHLWSLAVEEQFYIIWPFALWLAWRVNINLFILTLMVFCASLATNLIWVTSAPTQTFYWPFGRFWELLSGSLLAWVMVPKVNFLAYPENHPFKAMDAIKIKVASIVTLMNAWSITTLLGIFLLVFSFLFISKEFPYPSHWTVLPVLASLLIIIGGADNWLAKQVLTNRLAIWFGLISYPLYLWHWPILSFLHILDGGVPHRNGRILGILLAILLAWLTTKFIENPIRFGKFKEPYRAISLLIVMILIGVVGYAFSITNFQQSKTVDTVNLRKDLKYRIGSSSRWYEGKDDWLFLGNSHGRTVEKMMLKTLPTAQEIDYLHDTLVEVSKSADASQTQVALLIGPNKSTIYPEHLPSQFHLSSERFLDFFTDVLVDIPNVRIYDPTADIIELKASGGNLYDKTGSHWNSKGAYQAYKALMADLELPTPTVKFSPGPVVKEGIGRFTNLDIYPRKGDTTWNYTIEHKYALTRNKVENVALSEAFGDQEVVLNSNPLSPMKIWVLGDSFTTALKPYFDATFQEVTYLGHWNKRLHKLSTDLDNSSQKPDMIFIVRVERSFGSR